MQYKKKKDLKKINPTHRPYFFSASDDKHKYFFGLSHSTFLILPTSLSLSCYTYLPSLPPPSPFLSLLNSLSTSFSLPHSSYFPLPNPSTPFYFPLPISFYLPSLPYLLSSSPSLYLLTFKLSILSSPYLCFHTSLSIPPSDSLPPLKS